MAEASIEKSKYAEEKNLPLTPISNLKESIRHFYIGQLASEKFAIGAHRVRVQGIFEKDGSNRLKAVDSEESLSLSFSMLLNSFSPGDLLEIIGVLEVSVSKKGTGIFINLRPEECKLFSEGSFLESKKDNCIDIVSNCIRKNEFHGFESRSFPFTVKSISIIISQNPDSSILQDIGGEKGFKKSEHPHIEVNIMKIPITDPEEVAKAIAASKDSEVLLIARGGGDKASFETFNSAAVLQALNSCPSKQYRILALGHACDVPLAYLFADYRAQTPTSAGRALNSLLMVMYRQRKESQSKSYSIAKAQRVEYSSSHGQATHLPIESGEALKKLEEVRRNVCFLHENIENINQILSSDSTSANKNIVALKTTLDQIKNIIGASPKLIERKERHLKKVFYFSLGLAVGLCIMANPDYHSKLMECFQSIYAFFHEKISLWRQ